jgi:hypothetical protein
MIHARFAPFGLREFRGRQSRSLASMLASAFSMRLVCRLTTEAGTEPEERRRQEGKRGSEIHRNVVKWISAAVEHYLSLLTVK